MGNVVTFVTTLPTSCPTAGTAVPPRGGSGTQVTWTGTLGDDDSLFVAGAVVGARGAGGAPAASSAPAAELPVQVDLRILWELPVTLCRLEESSQRQAVALSGCLVGPAHPASHPWSCIVCRRDGSCRDVGLLGSSLRITATNYP